MGARMFWGRHRCKAQPGVRSRFGKKPGFSPDLRRITEKSHGGHEGAVCPSRWYPVRMISNDRGQQLRLQVYSVVRAVAELRQQVEQAKERFGLHSGPASKRSAIVDIGARAPWTSTLGSLLKRGAQGCLLVGCFALLGFALLSLGVFAGAAALAFVMVTRGLGWRVDVKSPAAV